MEKRNGSRLSCNYMPLIHKGTCYDISMVMVCLDHNVVQYGVFRFLCGKKKIQLDVLDHKGYIGK